MSTKAAVVERFDYDLSFQARMVRVLYQDPDFALSIGSHLNPDYFDRLAHRWMAQTILDYANKHSHGISLDAVRIEADKARATGRLQSRHTKTVDALISKLDRKVKDRSFIKEEVFRFVKNQATKEAVLDSIEHLKTGDFDSIDASFQSSIDVRMSLDGGLGHFMYGDNDERYERRKNYKKDGIPTGIFGIDQYMKPGGLPPGQLGAIIAPPNGGKTNSLIHIGKSAVLEGHVPALHITCELAQTIIEDRYDSSFTGTQINALEEGKNPKRIRQWWRDANDDFRGEALVVREVPMGQLSVQDLRNLVRQLERKRFYPGLIIVDYANLLRPVEGRTDNTYQDLGQIFIELCQWAKDLHVPIWTAMQGNRNSLGKEVITMKELADSFAPAMHADALLALCQTGEEKKRRRARYFFMKNRNGISEIEVPVKLDWSRSTVLNLSDAA